MIGKFLWAEAVLGFGLFCPPAVVAGSIQQSGVDIIDINRCVLASSIAKFVQRFCHLGLD